MSEASLDLSKLARDRSRPGTASQPPRRRRWVSRYVVPACILLGFIALLGAAAGRQLLPKPAVTVVPVIVKRGEAQPAGTALFQAAGWIEPRPTAVSVAALAPGVIEELLVVEGQQVEQGEPIARLIAVDAELAVQQAQATLAIREGELQRTRAEHKAAVTRLENPVHRRVQLADARSFLAKATTEKEKLPFLIQAAQAHVEFTRDSLAGKQAAKDAVAGVILDRAVRDHVAAEAELAELQQRGPHLQREIDAWEEKVRALEEQLELLVEERRQAEEAEAKIASARALRDGAKLRLCQAELMLERTVVRAPMQGRILRLIAPPGTRVMGLEHNAGQSSSTVVDMYDPKRLQVRADVRLENVPLVTPGAPVEIETASSGNVLQGRVLQPTSSANIQKNTLEVKVELIDPPPTVSPEMLVTATFLAPRLASERDASVEVERIFAPSALLHAEDGRSVVWIVDADQRAIRKEVAVRASGPEGLVEITQGLNATDKLIASGVEQLTSGQPVMIRGEDPVLGMEK